jgi:hypothetical protein
MESTYLSFSKEPPPHYHPNQEEFFEVLSGSISVRIDNEVRILSQGETLHIPVNKTHSMWNHTNDTTVVNWKVKPALETEYFLEIAMGLANDGKTNQDGVPSILQIALLFAKFSEVFRLAKTPYIIQKILFSMISPFAYLLGYKPSYSKYID